MAMAGGGGGGGNAAAIEAGRAVVRLTADDAGLRSKLDKGRRMVLGWGKSIAGAGAGLFAAGGGILGTIFGSFSGAVEKFDGIKKAADRLGTSAETISALGYAAEKSGSSLEEMESAAKNLQRNLVVNADAFDQFGLSAEKLKGMGLDEQMAAVADAIAGMDDPADRTAAAMTLLGKSGTRLLPLFKDGAKGLRGLMKEAKDVGSVVGGGDAANAERSGDAIDRVWTSLKNTFLAVGAALLPQVERIEQISAFIVEGAATVREFINENRQLVLIVTGVAGGLAAAGAALVGLGTALAVGSFAVGGLVSGLSAVGAVVSTIWAWLPTIAIVGGIAAAVAGLGYALYKFTPVGEHVRTLFAEIGRIANWAFGIVSIAWEGISAAFEAGDLSGALDVAMATLDVFWAALKVGAQKAWNAVANYAEGAWHDVVGIAKKALVDIDTQLQVFGTNKKGYLIDLYTSIWKIYIDGWKDAYKRQLDMAKAAVEGDWKMRKWLMDNWKSLLAGAVGMSGLGTVVGAQKKGIEHAATNVAQGEALAQQVGAQTAEEIIRAKGEELKAQIDAVQEAKKKAMAEKRGAELAAAIAELEAMEKALQERVNEVKRRAAGFQGDPVFGMAARILQDPMLGARPQPQQKQAEAGLSDLVQGQFGGANAQAKLGGTMGSKEQKELEKHTELLERIEKKVGGIIAA